MPLDLPREWPLIKQRLSKNPAIYSQPEKLIQLLDFCANSIILKKLIVQISRSRLVFCRYVGDVGYPCIYATNDRYVVSTFTNDEQYLFTELDELLSFVEDRIATVDKEFTYYSTRAVAYAQGGRKQKSKNERKSGL